MKYRRTLGRKVVLLLLISTILLPSVVGANPSWDEDHVVLDLVNLRLLLNESWHDNVRLVRYAPHNITSSIYPTDPSIVETIVYVSLYSDENSRSVSHRGDSPWYSSEFMPLAEEYTVEIMNNGQIAEVFVNVSIVQIGPPTTPIYTESGWLPSGIILLLSATVVPLVILASSLVYYRRKSNHYECLPSISNETVVKHI